MQPVVPSSTDVSVSFFVYDSTTFLPYTGLTAATGGLALAYRKGATGAETAITETNLSALTDAHSDGGLKHVRGAEYRLDLPDAAVPTAEHEVTTFGGTATGYVILGGALVGKPVEVVSGSLVAASVSGAVGSVTGAVGSVTGAVGSVTGNVGGNVVGSVGSVTGAVGSVTGAVGSVGAGGITAASIATGAVDADAIAADAGAKLADTILRRTAANIEASANGDTLGVESVYGLIMAAFESAVSGTTWTVRKTDATTLGTKTVAVDSAADPIVSVT